jgi:hypothetical protein
MKVPSFLWPVQGSDPPSCGLPRERDPWPLTAAARRTRLQLMAAVPARSLNPAAICNPTLIAPFR